METCINYCEPGWAFMSTDERRWINSLQKLSKNRPEECVILKKPEDNDGYIYVKFPQRWIKVRPPREGRPMTDEHKAAVMQALSKYREEKAKS